MDANGQGFWMLADPGDWPWRRNVHWDPRTRVLKLASRRTWEPRADQAQAAADANAALERVPRACDRFGAVAWWDPERQAVLCRSPEAGAVELLALTERPSDLLVGFDGVFYVVRGDGVLLHDLRQRWSDVTISAAEFTPWRAAAHPAGGLWLLERDSGRLARLQGLPMAFDDGTPMGTACSGPIQRTADLPASASPQPSAGPQPNGPWPWPPIRREVWPC